MRPLLLAGLATAGLAVGCAAGGARQGVASGDVAGVHRGPLAAHLLLSGELEAERSAALPVPLTPNRQVQIRWLAADGAAVAVGERVIEFDNSDLARSLEDQRLAAFRAREELAS